MLSLLPRGAEKEKEKNKEKVKIQTFLKTLPARAQGMPYKKFFFFLVQYKISTILENRIKHF